MGSPKIREAPTSPAAAGRGVVTVQIGETYTRYRLSDGRRANTNGSELSGYHLSSPDMARIQKETNDAK